MRYFYLRILGITEQPIIDSNGTLIQESYVPVLCEIANDILDFIDNKHQDIIEPFLLSVLCSRLFEIAQMHNKESLVFEDLKTFNIKTIIREFYEELLLSLRKEGLFPSNADDYINYIEDNLVSSKNGMRSRISMRDIYTNKKIKELIKNNEFSFKRLEDIHLVRCTTFGDDTFIEIVHDRIAEAIFERQCERQKPTINIYISSTFRDLREERDSIVRYVIPIIQKEAKERGIFVKYVDLRWGVTEDDFISSRFMDIIFSEIQKCDLFIGIYGNRYDWCPSLNYLDESFLRQYPWINNFTKKTLSIQELEYYAMLHSSKKKACYIMFKFPQEDLIDKKQKIFLDFIKSQHIITIYHNISDFQWRLLSDTKAFLYRIYPNHNAVTFQDTITQLTSCYLYTGGLEILNDFMNSKGHMLILTGATGIGKSALIANWITSRSETHKMLFYFIGLYDNNDSILNYITSKISESLSIPFIHQEGTDAVRKELQYLYTKLESPLTIILDGLNQTYDNNIQDLLNTLPEHKYVKYILTINNEGYKGESRLLCNTYFYNMQRPTIQQIEKIIKLYLNCHAKSLPVKFVEIIARDTKSVNLHIVRQLLDLLIEFSSNDNLDYYLGKYSTTNISGWYQFIILEYERILFKHKLYILGVIAISSKGVEEELFKEIFSDYEWDSLIDNLYNYITSVNGKIVFTDAYFRDAIKQHFISNKESEEYYRRLLINYYSKNNSSNIDELLFQYEELLNLYKSES